MAVPRSGPMRSRARRLVVSILVAACAALGLLGSSLTTTGVAAASGPLPACRYADILTTPRAYDDWSQTLVDTILAIPRTYVPPDLTAVSKAGLNGPGLYVRGIVIPDLKALAEAAEAAGNPLAVQSAYRSYATQQTTFAYWVGTSGYSQALLYSARPGHSEHQLGLAIDFKSAAGGVPWSGGDWGVTPAGAWMREHAWQYGFIQSYPKGKRSKTCYDYESWHFRYVGRDEAAAIHASGLTIREFLWRTYTTAFVPAAGGSGTASHAPSAAPSVRPSAAPSDVDPTAQPTALPSASTPRASNAASGTSGRPRASPTPEATITPLTPVGTWFGVDPLVLAVSAALVVVVVALFASLAIGRRRRGAA